MSLLKFGKGNAKLQKGEITFSLPSGFTCPSAKICLSKADRETGKIRDGADTQFRCFAASMESRLPALRQNVWHNFDLLVRKSQDEMAQLIQDSLSAVKSFDVVRIHVGGDYFNESYFLAWRSAAKLFPSKRFYSYTKRIDLLVKHGQVTDNHTAVASYGGTLDGLIDEHNLVSAKVVYTEAEATELGLEIDHDDSHAIKCERSFALLLHGSQPKGSEASKAMSALRKAGWKGYS